MLLLVSFVDNMAVKFQHKETIMKHMGYLSKFARFGLFVTD